MPCTKTWTDIRSKVVLIFDPLGGKPKAVLIFGAVLSLGPVLIFGAGV